MRCNFLINSFLAICSEIGLPISMEKMEYVSEILVFLGILLDGQNYQLAIPVEKDHRAVKITTVVYEQN